MKRSYTLVILLFSFSLTRPQSRELAAVAMKDSVSAPRSNDQGIVLKGIEGAWLNTADGKYFRYIQHTIDPFIGKDGSIRNYHPENADLTDIDKGNALLLLYNVTGNEKYWKAASSLRQQLFHQPRMGNGVFRHIRSVNDQFFGAGDLYMVQPFYTAYARLAHEDTAFNDIARQFTAMERLVRNASTGLLYDRWPKARPEMRTLATTSDSWALPMGLYGMALVDVLENFPAHHPRHDTLTAILQRYAAAIKKAQDQPTGGRSIYISPTARAMFVYTLAKGMRLGSLPNDYLQIVKKQYDGLIKQLNTDSAQVYLTSTTSGPTGKYRSSANKRSGIKDPLSIGAFLQAANEMDIASTRSIGKGRTVLLDNFFNHEVKKDVTGHNIDWHYKWDEWSNGGFFLLGHAFRKYGMQTEQLDVAPAADNLRKADIFVIVDPDTKKEADQPNYIIPGHSEALYNWVKEGGVLVLMGNDTGNAEFEHFNQLAGRFGIHFNEDCRNRVPGDQYEAGAFSLINNEVLTTAKKIYLKEISTIAVTAPAKAVLTDKGDVIMAVSRVGKGAVFAVGDPWIYNEYTDGRKLPAEYENYRAANDLIRWLIQQCPKK